MWVSSMCILRLVLLQGPVGDSQSEKGDQGEPGAQVCAHNWIHMLVFSEKQFCTSVALQFLLQCHLEQIFLDSKTLSSSKPD